MTLASRSRSRRPAILPVPPRAPRRRAQRPAWLRKTRVALGAGLLAGGLAAGLAVPGPAAAQDATAKAEQLIDELRALIEQGRQQRAADRAYLQELEDLVARYDWPWQRTLLADDFSQEGPAPAAPWRVIEPEWRLDWRHGLRSVVRPPAQAQGQAQPQAQQRQEEQRQPTAEEAAKQIIGGLLQEALRGRDGQREQSSAEQQPQQSTDDPGYAAVQAPLNLPNAFAVTLQVSRRALGEVAQPRLDVGVYQGQRTDTGYRLVLRPGAGDGAASLSLLKLGTGGTSSTLEIWNGDLGLAGDQARTLQWTRDRQGRMQVALDGQTVFSVVDRGYNDPFDGVVVINSGGDFALRQARVQAVPQG